MNSGSIAFIIICAALVFLMTPALAFFYGGLERRKNVINTMLMAVIPLGLASILWVAIGYSLSFSGDGAWIGNLGHAFFNGVSTSNNSLHGLEIPDALFWWFPDDVLNHHGSDSDRFSGRTDAFYAIRYFHGFLANHRLLSIGTHGLGRWFLGSDSFD
jgi:hypothetical protein